MIKQGIWRHFDFWLFGSVVVLCIFGIAMIRSAVAGNIELATYVTRQIIFVSLGLAVIIITAIIDYHYWASLVRLFYVGVFVLLVVVFIFSKASFGSARWIETGLVNIQPSELAKVVLILTLAEYFSSSQNEAHDLKWIAKSLIITGGFVVWIVLQPNLSTTIVLLFIWVVMIWVSGIDIKYIFTFFLVGTFGGVGIFPLLEPYQRQRILNFIVPNPNATYGETYNVEQALISIGSGGWLGEGYGHGTQVQLRFLKVRHTDFIFSAMAEEFGFIGTIIVIALLIFVIIRIMRAGRLANDAFGALIAYSFGMLMFFQTAVNIGVNMKLVPVTGLTLPFISYGGSSLLSMILGVGLVESIVLRQKPLEF
jgi:rod shape determining protein RodA